MADLNLTDLGYKSRPGTQAVSPGYSTKQEFAHPGMFTDPSEPNVEVMSDGDETMTGDMSTAYSGNM